MHSKLPKLPRVKVILLYYLKINEKGIYIYPFGYVVFSFKQQRNAEKKVQTFTTIRLLWIYFIVIIIVFFRCLPQKSTLFLNIDFSHIVDL